MSLKKYFAEGYSKNSLPNTGDQVKSEVESLKYIKARSEENNKFIPHVDFSSASNFARYGSAEKYYEDAFTHIYQEYPYDGSLKEKTEWDNSLLFVDRYVFDNLYPRTTGYVKLGEEYGTKEASVSDYGGVPTASYEYIRINGGPNLYFEPPGERDLPASTYLKLDNANRFKLDEGRSSNLNFDLSSAKSGSTVEFWMHKQAMVSDSTTNREVIFDLWNGHNSQSADYGRLTIEMQTVNTTNPLFKVTAQSGSPASGFFSEDIGTLTADDVIETTAHYAFAFKNEGSNIKVSFYHNGELNEEKLLGTSINAVTGAMRANIGSLVHSPSGTAYMPSVVGSETMNGWGKLSASLDEFRYWRTERDAKEIKRYYRTQVGGGTNTDFDKHDKFSPVELGVYFKFNEGITQTSSVDSVVLDYSGRVSNGVWTGYAQSSRDTGSLIDNASINDVAEFKDPIIYSFHPTVVSKLDELKTEGRMHDQQNTALLYNNFPSWMLQEDSESTLYRLTQIIGSYFDNLHLHVEALPRLKDATYPSASFKPRPYGEKLLDSVGLDTPELFIDTKLIEIFEARDEKVIYEKDLSEVKNLIYQNIYNNLVNIYKSKGTENSFRNLIRCFGVDSEILNVNIYSDNDVYTFEENYKPNSVRKTYLDFNGAGTFDSYAATVYLTASATDALAGPGYISASNDYRMDYIPFSMESDVIFPRKVSQLGELGFRSSTFLSSSIFGLHLADPDTHGSDTTWPSYDQDLRVYAVRSGGSSKNAKFVLTGSLQSGSPASSVLIETDTYLDVYDEAKWNFAVRLKHEDFPYTNGIDGTVDSSKKYILEFYGAAFEAGFIRQSFYKTASIELGTPVQNILRKPKRPYIGAHRTNFTGSVQEYSDVKIGSFRFWQSYLDNEAVQAHARDPRNVGSLNPSKNAFFLDDSLTGSNIPQIETLVMNWEFQKENNLTSSAGGVIEDILDWSSGSTEAKYDTQHKFLGAILNRAHTGRGFGFSGSSGQMFKDEYVFVHEQQPIETVNSDSTVNILSEDDELFTRDSRPVKHVVTVEKSMNRVVSNEMLKYFGSMKDLNNIVGEPVNRYRKEYKALSKIRHLFYEKVQNTPDIDKFLDFYKWLDFSVNYMVSQLSPASARVSAEFGDVIESHILERNKYHNKFPSMKDTLPKKPLSSIPKLNPNWFRKGAFLTSPIDPGSFPSQIKDLHWWKYKARKADIGNSSGDAVVDADRQTIGDSITQTIERQATALLKNFEVSDHSSPRYSIHGGINYPLAKKTDYILSAVRPHGPAIDVSGMLLPLNAMTIASSSITASLNKFNANTDFALDFPNTKRRIQFKAINQREDENSTDKSYASAKGDIFVPFSLFSGTVETGYNKEVVDEFASGVVLTNLHSDDYGSHGETPIQGPFTFAHVGGRKHRHVRPNRSSSYENFTTTNGLDDERTRPEAFKLLLGAESSTTGETGLIGLVGPDYPALDDTLYPDVDTAFSTYYRNTLSKRPLNIRNISYNTGSAILGNYRSNHEVINTTGRKENNLYFRLNGASASYSPSAYLTGVVDFELPDRSSKKTKSIFVSRFSAPGGPEVNARGFLDLEAEEYSVYNALPYRNLTVRQPLNQLLSQHAGPFGLNWLNGVEGGHFPAINQGGNVYAPFPNPAAEFLSTSSLDGSQVASFHKVNRNRGRKLILSGTAGTTVVSASQFDNAFITHPIPRSDLQYSWITASAEYSRYLGHAPADGYYFITTAGEIPAIEFLKESDREETPDFAGINRLLYETVDTETNTVGELPSENDINKLILHRGGPYGYPSWKQVRQGQHAIIREQNKKSVFSLTDDPVTVSGDGYILKPARETITNFTESAVSFNNRPMQVELRFRDNDYNFKFSYGNFKELFKSAEVNKRLKNFNPSFNLDPEVKPYETIKKLSQDPEVAITKLVYSEGVFPKEENAGLNRTRDKEDYAEIAGTGSNGYDRISLDRRKFWGADDDRLRTSESTVTRKPHTHAASGSYLNSLGYKYGSSVWPLELSVYPTGTVYDDFAGFLTASIRPAIQEYHSYAAGAAYVTGNLKTVAGGAFGELHISLGAGDRSGAELSFSPLPVVTGNNIILDPNLKGMFGTVNYESPRTPLGSDERLLLAYKYPTASIFYSYLPELGFSSSAEFVFPHRVHEQAGRQPWYDTYQDYADELRRLGKGYSILPEYKMSENIDTLLDSANLFKNNKMLTLAGAGDVTSSAHASSSTELERFFKEYSHSDFLSEFSDVKQDFSNFSLEKLTLKCKGVKKILPYNGFYPVTRTTQLASLLSQSVAPYLSGSYYGSAHADPNAQFTFTERPLSGALAVQSLMQPFFAPGIMYNTIKSGIACDWPSYTGSLALLDTEQISTPSAFAVSFIATQAPNYRIPFEIMTDLEFEKALPEEEVYLFAPDKVSPKDPASNDNPFLRYPFFKLTKERISKRRPNFELASQNFFGEVPKFFLDGGKLNYFKSKRNKEFKPFVSGNTYYMDVKLYKTDNFDMIRSAVSGIVYNQITTTPDTVNPTDGNINNRPRSYHGRYFGPPMQYHTNSLGVVVHRGLEYSDPAYAPFTPPYFYGESKVTVAYTADKENPTVEEILSKATYTYTNSALNGEYAGSGSDVGIFKRLQATGSFHPPVDYVSAAQKAMMNISSSVNLRGRKIESKQERDTSGGTITFKTLDGTPGEDDVWVISPKFECPTLNFSGSPDQHPTEYSGAVGMWSSYGTEPLAGQGIFLELGDTYTKGLVAENTGSLIEQCGFDSSNDKFGNEGFDATTLKRRIGRVAKSKKISEAIVAIPFFEKEIKQISLNLEQKSSTPSSMFSTVTRDEYNGRHFVGINKEVFNVQRRNVLDFNSPALKKGFSFKGETLEQDIKNTSVSNMIKKMNKFVIPPQFDFLNFDSIDPFVMYIFEFEAELNKQDLSDIWQGVMPAPRKNNGFAAELQEVEISHGFSKFEFYEGNQNFLFGQKDNKVRWLVFKVKQRAEKFYANIADPQYIDGEKKLVKNTSADHIHYNWPYDFFSLVEVAKIGVDMEMNPKKEKPKFEQLGTLQEISPIKQPEEDLIKQPPAEVATFEPVNQIPVVAEPTTQTALVSSLPSIIFGEDE